jgi:hypothetical protein
MSTWPQLTDGASSSSLPAVGAVEAGTIAAVLGHLSDEGFSGRLTVVGPRAGEIVCEFGDVVAVTITNHTERFSTRAAQMEYLLGATDGWYRTISDKAEKKPAAQEMGSNPPSTALHEPAPAPAASAPAASEHVGPASNDNSDRSSGMFFPSSNQHELRSMGSVTLSASEWRALEPFFHPVHSDLLPEHQLVAIEALTQRGLLRYEPDSARPRQPSQSAVSSSLLDALRITLAAPVIAAQASPAPAPSFRSQLPPGVTPSSAGAAEAEDFAVGATRVSSLRRLVGSLRR